MGAPYSGGEVRGPAFSDVTEKVDWVEKFVPPGHPGHRGCPLRARPVRPSPSPSSSCKGSQPVLVPARRGLLSSAWAWKETFSRAPGCFRSAPRLQTHRMHELSLGLCAWCATDASVISMAWTPSFSAIHSSQ